MTLSQQANYIYGILSDFQWHCPIEWGYADGHAKRITDINNYLKPLGQEIVSDWCDCGRHTAKIKKRKIVPITPKFNVEAWQSQWPKVAEVKEISKQSSFDF